MSRIYLISSRGQALAGKLNTLLTKFRSVRMLTAALNRVSHGRNSVIYAGRIHSLLSADKTRSLNEEQFMVIENAVQHFLQEGSVPEEDGDTDNDLLKRQCRSLSQQELV